MPVDSSVTLKTINKLLIISRNCNNLQASNKQFKRMKVEEKNKQTKTPFIQKT